MPPGNVSITVNGVTQSASINSSTGNFSSSFTTGSLGVPGSPHTIAYKYDGDTNFNAVGPDTSKSLTVTKRPITVTADGKSKVYGDSDPALTYQITSGSLASGDCFSGALSRTAGENVGSYAIHQGTLALSGNYNLTFAGANLTITQRALTVTAEAKGFSLHTTSGQPKG